MTTDDDRERLHRHETLETYTEALVGAALGVVRRALIRSRVPDAQVESTIAELRIALKGAALHWMSAVYEEGAARTRSMQSAIDTQRAHIDKLDAELREAREKLRAYLRQRSRDR